MDVDTAQEREAARARAEEALRAVVTWHMEFEYLRVVHGLPPDLELVHALVRAELIALLGRRS